ncbi:MAG: hypothetical protein WCF84_15255, partial [Anaerolineae bacterium]
MKRNAYGCSRRVAYLVILLLFTLLASGAGTSHAQDIKSRSITASLAVPAGQVALNCQGSLGGYKLEVDQAHSSVSGSEVICNYTAQSQDKPPTTSGFAITVDYFCPADAQSAWRSRTGTAQPPWDPQNNPNGRIGSQGGNSLLIREDGLVSGFAGDFTVTEKLFLLVDPQTIATVLVHTDVKQPAASPGGNAPAPDPKVLNLDANATAALAAAIAAAHHALVNGLNCSANAGPTASPTAPPKSLKVQVLFSDLPDPMYAGDPVTLRGIVWTVDKDGWYHLPTQAKLHITQGSSGAVDVTSNAVGYFSVGFTPSDDRDPNLRWEATPLSPDYQAETGYFRINFKSRGSLTITVATDKAVYAPGEPVTFFGTV